MDLITPEYEFLDLSDVRETDLCSLKSALFEHRADSRGSSARSDSTIERCSEWSGSSGSGSGVTVSSSAESGAGGECGMAAQSPARAPQHAPPHAPHGAPHAAPHAPPYAPPPHPPYAPLQPPPHQWPVAPPNVYVSQVTANVNVHGYMGQYYQPGPPYGAERGRTPRRERRGKRPASPPQQPQPYYLAHTYPHYYPHPAQAQGAPLYHLPVYQPLVYGPYAYPPYYPEYPVPVEGEPVDKGPDEYSQEVVMEQEAIDAYYANAQYVGPGYGAPPEGPLEYAPVFMPPPALPGPHPPTHTPHQFNVHAKNFVQGQGHKTYTPPDTTHEQKPSPTTTSNSASGSVESLPMKDLKIAGKGPGSPKHAERPAESQSKPSPTTSDKTPPAPKMDPAKPAWTPAETKPAEVTVPPTAPLPPKTFPPTASATQPAGVKVPPVSGKPGKGPAAPFSGGKQAPKPAVPQAAVPVQQTASTPKAPFGNRQKRDGPTTRSPSGDATDSAERPMPAPDHAKRDPPLPPSKAPMPISITLHSQGPPLIVTNKSPFGRKSIAPEPAPAPPPQPPPAPTASDFPPPPTPRNRGDAPPAPAVAPQPHPAPGKSWASLFSSKPAAAPPQPAPEEPPSPTPTTPPAAPNVQKPVAKVPPFDASPLQGGTDKAAPPPRPVTTQPPAVSYSEKTSVNAVSNVPQPSAAPAKPPTAETTVPIQKDPNPAVPVAPSPFADDPNSYRMGEFLTKYQLDNRAVGLVPRGLTNRSNYCYVNAILQALIACPPFYNMLKALPYQTRRGKSSTPVIDSMVELCYEFSPLCSGGTVGRAGRGRCGGGAELGAGAALGGPPLDGAAGLRVLRALRPFPGSQEGRQEDAEEFLGCLLNSLNDEMLELMKLVEPEEPKESGGAAQPNGVIPPDQPRVEDDDDDEWKVMGPRNRGAVERRWGSRRTPVADIFRGRTRTRLHRATHPHHLHPHDVTDAVHPFFTLQLDIERATSVKEALDLLAGKDALEGVGEAWQQVSLEHLPVVLLLHLKCFQLDSDGHTAKIVKTIDYPIDLKIDPKIMSSKCKYTQKQRVYKLFAVVYHEGVEAVKGHYVTDTYHGQAGWIRYDDSTVTQVTDAQVLKPKPPRMPYLLMYRRHDTLPTPHRPTPKPE